jgi:hypothetical protein
MRTVGVVLMVAGAFFGLIDIATVQLGWFVVAFFAFMVGLLAFLDG